MTYHFVAGEADAARSSVVVSKNNALADSKSNSSEVEYVNCISVHIADKYNNAKKGATVEFDEPTDTIEFVGGVFCTTDEEGKCSVKITSKRPGNYLTEATLDGVRLNGSPVNFDFLSGGKWHIDKAKTLDIDRSQGAELPSLSLDSADKLYAAWIEGSASVWHYHVKELDSNGSWRQLGNKIDKGDVPVEYIMRPLLRIEPGTDKLFVRYRLGKKLARDAFWENNSWKSDVNCIGKPFLWYANMAFSQSGKRTDSHIEYDRNRTKMTFVSAVKQGNSWDAYDNINLPLASYKRSYVLIKQDGYPFVMFEEEQAGSLPKAAFYNYEHMPYTPLSQYRWNSLDSKEGICFSSVVYAQGTDNEVVVAYHDNNGSHSKIKAFYYNQNNGQNALGEINGAVDPDDMGGVAAANGSNQCVNLTKAQGTNTLYVAWQHADRNGKRSIYISTYDTGVQAWVEAAPPLVVEGSIRGPSLVVDSEGIISVAVMYDTTPGTEDMDDVRVYRYNPNEENEE